MEKIVLHKYIKKKKIKNNEKNKIFFIKERDRSGFIFLLQKKHNKIFKQ